MIKGRVLIVEGDPAFAQLLVMRFQREGFKVDHTSSGIDAISMAKEYLPDLLLINSGISGLSGMEVCRRLRRFPSTVNLPIIVFGARDDEEDRVESLVAGADDYMLISVSNRELIARAQAIFRRRRPALGGQKLTFADLELDPVNHRVNRNGVTIPLRPAEFRLLRHFLEHPERLFSRENLLDTLWGHGHGINVRAVDSHVRELRKALNRSDQKDLIRTERFGGYRLTTNIAMRLRR